MNLVKVRDHPGLARDMNSKAVLSTDERALRQYRARRKRARELASEQRETAKTIEDLRAQVEELRSAMSAILGK